MGRKTVSFVSLLMLGQATTNGHVPAMNKLDIWRTAKLLFNAHGPHKAWQVAAGRAVELLGDPVGCAAWVSVIDALDELALFEIRTGETMQ